MEDASIITPPDAANTCIQEITSPGKMVAAHDDIISIGDDSDEEMADVSELSEDVDETADSRIASLVAMLATPGVTAVVPVTLPGQTPHDLAQSPLLPGDHRRVVMKLILPEQMQIGAYPTPQLLIKRPRGLPPGPGRPRGRPKGSGSMETLLVKRPRGRPPGPGRPRGRPKGSASMETVNQLKRPRGRPPKDPSEKKARGRPATNPKPIMKSFSPKDFKLRIVLQNPNLQKKPAQPPTVISQGSDPTIANMVDAVGNGEFPAKKKRGRPRIHFKDPNAPKRGPGRPRLHKEPPTPKKRGRPPKSSYIPGASPGATPSSSKIMMFGAKRRGRPPKSSYLLPTLPSSISPSKVEQELTSGNPAQVTESGQVAMTMNLSETSMTMETSRDPVLTTPTKSSSPTIHHAEIVNSLTQVNLEPMAI